MANAIALVVPVVAGLIALCAYRYKNRIGFSVISISGDVPENSKIGIPRYAGNLQAERLRLKNYGLRSLENVELHYAMSTEPEVVKIKDPTSLSKSAIKTSWDNKVMTITTSNLPSGEEIVIETFRVGHYDLLADRVRGTGGKYKVVQLERYELKRETTEKMLPWALFFIYGILVSIGI